MIKEPKTKPVYFTQAIYDAVKALAYQRGGNISDMFSSIMFEYLEAHKLLPQQAVTAAPAPAAEPAEWRASYEFRRAIHALQSILNIDPNSRDYQRYVVPNIPRYLELAAIERPEWTLENYPEARAWLRDNPMTKAERKLWKPQIDATNAAIKAREEGQFAADQALVVEQAKETITDPNPAQTALHTKLLDDWVEQ